MPVSLARRVAILESPKRITLIPKRGIIEVAGSGGHSLGIFTSGTATIECTAWMIEFERGSKVAATGSRNREKVEKRVGATRADRITAAA